MKTASLWFANFDWLAWLLRFPKVAVGIIFPVVAHVRNSWLMYIGSSTTRGGSWFLSEIRYRVSVCATECALEACFHFVSFSLDPCCVWYLLRGLYFCFCPLRRSIGFAPDNFHCSSTDCPAEKYCTCEEAHDAHAKLNLYPGYSEPGGCHQLDEHNHVKIDCYYYNMDESHRELWSARVTAFPWRDVFPCCASRTAWAEEIVFIRLYTEARI